MNEPSAEVSTDPRIVEAIRADFRSDRSGMTMMAARRHGVPEQVVVEALRGDGWPIRKLRPGCFAEIMQALAEFGPLRVFVRSRAAILEVVGRFGGYSETGPFFNVQTDEIDMHILPAELASIYAVEKHGHDTAIVTHSLQFFDGRGDAALKAFLWEDFPRVPEHRIAAFRALVERLGEPAENGERTPPPSRGGVPHTPER